MPTRNEVLLEACASCPPSAGIHYTFAVGKNSFYFCLGRDQLFTFRGPDRQLYLFAAAAGRNRRGNAISCFRVGFHGVVEQYRVAAFQRYAQRRGRFDTEELKSHAGRLGREIDQDVLVRMRHVAHADGRAVAASVLFVNDGNPPVHIFKPGVTVLSAMRMIPSSLSWLITPQKFPPCISGAAYAMPIVGQFLK